MDPNLHVTQAVNLLNRVLNYYPFVQEGDTATVALTREDWYVVADLLFHMDVGKEVLPDSIKAYTLADDHRSIELRTDDCLITVEMS